MPNKLSDKAEVPVPVKENIFYEQLEAVPAHKVELVFKTAAGKEMTMLHQIENSLKMTVSHRIEKSLEMTAPPN